VAKAQTAHDNFKTTVGIVVGTRSFLAPEILRGAPATKQSDIYSLGLILKFLLTGEMPTVAADGEKQAPVLKYNRLLPQPLLNLMTRMTQPNTNTRFTDLKDVLRELKQVSLNGIPPELLTAVRDNAPIANLEKLLEACSVQGLDIIDSRMAINLAAKPGTAAPAADNGKTQVMNLKAVPEMQVTHDALARAIVRVQKTKALVPAGGLKAHITGPVAVPTARPQPPPQEPLPPKPATEISYFKIGFVLIVGFLALRAFVASSAGGEVFGVLKNAAAGIEKVISGRRPASGN
jgi:serine/threonine-protein kinase